MRTLYVVSIGDLVKVGTSGAPARRYQQYQAEARAARVPFEVLLELRQVEADQNEQEVIRRFFDHIVRGNEYFLVDPAVVVAFARSLPCTLVELDIADTSQGTWMSSAEAAQALGRDVQTLALYAKSGLLVKRKNEHTRRVYYHSTGVERLALELAS